MPVIIHNLFPSAFRDLLLSNATYAWFGDDLPAEGPIASWLDVAGGSAASQILSTRQPAVGVLNGRRAAAYDGARMLRAIVAPMELPVRIVSVARVDGMTTAQVLSGYAYRIATLAANRTLGNDITLIRRNNAVVYNGAPALPTAEPFVAMLEVTESSVALWINDTQTASVTGLASFTPATDIFTIGSDALSNSPSQPLIGLIGSVGVFSGTNYVLRSNAIASAARIYYDI